MMSFVNFETMRRRRVVWRRGGAPVGGAASGHGLPDAAPGTVLARVSVYTESPRALTLQMLLQPAPAVTALQSTRDHLKMPCMACLLTPRW
jgi:hypothetical protein